MTRAEKIKSILDKEGNIETEIRKNIKRGKVVQGIVIGSGKTRPTIYPDLMEEDTDEEIIAMIRILSREAIPQFDFSRVKDWNEGKKHCMVIARPVTKDAAVTMPFLDIELCVRIRFDENHSTLVTQDILENYGITKEQLFEDANEEQVYIVKTVIDHLNELSEVLEEERIEEADDDYGRLLMATNKEYFYGAGAIAHQSLMYMIAEIVDGDLYILPSSVHEILICPANVEIEGMKEMVKQTNQECVPMEDFLSNNVYIYRKDERKLVIA